MLTTATKDCATCVNRDRPILIVGPHRFNNEVLANFIRSRTPARCSVAARLREADLADDLAQGPWRLIFLDCHRLPESGVRQLVQIEAVHLLQQHIVALLNLPLNNSLVLDLLKLGVRGFFFEHDHPDFILRGICALKRGELWVARETMMEYICQQPAEAGQENCTASRLTRREKIILSLLASGAKNEAIAANLYISPHTVKSHIYNAFRKIGAKNRLQAAFWAAKNLS